MRNHRSYGNIDNSEHFGMPAGHRSGRHHYRQEILASHRLSPRPIRKMIQGRHRKPQFFSPHQAFSVCPPTAAEKMQKGNLPVKMLTWQKENTVRRSRRAAGMDGKTGRYRSSW